MEIQQSSFYARYIQKLGWVVERIDGSYVYIRRFPFIGSLTKIQRVTKLPNLKKLTRLLRTHGVTRVAIEPDATINEERLRRWCGVLAREFKIIRSPFLPTKTLLIDLSPPEEVIFHRFTEAKRRAVRRALKNKVVIKESRDISAVARIKNKSAGFLGFLTTSGIDKLWSVFPKDNKAILLAKGEAAMLLLFWDSVAYYWIAGATKKGKKLFAPTLLIWEALKLSKKHGCKLFDFVGIFDERRPEKEQRDWRGFTRFKEGFGGKSLYYPLSSIDS